jgi:3-phenylpropionate/trans-cinnamate dioxygenase ferredoxin reductase component
MTFLINYKPIKMVKPWLEKQQRKSIMANYKYLIIGSGMTAAAAVKGIREVDADGSIAVFGAEWHRPYNRPPLSKKLWSGKSRDSIWLDLSPDNLELFAGCRVTAVNPDKKQVQDEEGRSFGYQKLLLATGGEPRRLANNTEDILYYRTLDDYDRLRSWTQKGARIGVIGGGFIGSEIAAALALNHEQVVMIIPESAIGAKIYPEDLAKFVTDYYRKNDVDIHTGMKIQSIKRHNSRFFLQAEDGQVVEVDHIVAGIGLLPNTELAHTARIETAANEAGGGFLVDPYLHTNQPDIYAAGDVASSYIPFLNRRMRFEHEDNANTMGRIAGLNMAGRVTPYDHLSFFYSDLFDLGYEAVGELDSRLDTFADWQETFNKGVIYYLRDRKICGVLLWNTWGQVEAVRKLIAAGQTYEKSELKGLSSTVNLNQ